MEIHRYLLRSRVEGFQIGGLGEFIPLVHIYVVHQDEAVLADELECARTLHGILCQLFVIRAFHPFARGERFGGCYLDAVAVAFGLVEQMVLAFERNDVAVDT